MGRTWLPWVLVVCCVGVVLVLLVDPASDTTVAESDPPDVTSEPTAGDPWLEGRGVDAAPATREIPPNHRLTLRGRVETLEGTPLPGRVVTAWIQAPRQAASIQEDVESLEGDLRGARGQLDGAAQATSREDGTFELRHIDRMRDYRITTEAQTGEVAVPVWYHSDDTPPSSPYRIVVGPGARYEGRVVDPQGHGLRAWVSMHVPGNNTTLPKPLRDWVSPQIRTGADGHFVFPSVPEGELHLDVIIAGAARIGCFPAHAPTPTPVTVQPGLLGTAVLTGHVAAAGGEPLASARVLLKAREAGDATRWNVRETQTDAGGTYRFEGLMPGKITAMSVEARGGGSVSNQHAGLVLVADVIVEADIVFPAMGTVSGRAVDPEGAPLAGLTVVARDVSSVLPVILERGITDADGRFHFKRLRAGAVNILAWGAGWVQTPPDALSQPDLHALLPGGLGGTQVIVKPGATNADVRLVLRRGTSLQGQVVFDSGGPTAGAVVTIVPPALALISRPHRTQHVLADENGQFRFDGLDPETKWTLSATADGHRSLPRAITKTEFEGAAPVTLTVVPTHAVRVRVVDAEDGPLAEFHVSFPGMSFSAETGADGQVVFGAVPAGRHAVTWRPEELYLLEPLRLEIEVGPDGDDPVVLRWPGTLHAGGVVVDADGRPLAGEEIHLRTDTMKAWHRHSAETDGEGRFEFRWLDAGSYRVTIGEVTLDERLEAGDMEARLVRPTRTGQRIVGVLLDPEGQPLHQATISAHAPGGKPIADLDTDYVFGNGQFKLDVPEGVTTVTLVIESTTRANGLQDLHPRHVIESVHVGTEEKLKITVPLGITIAGRVLDPSGAPVAGAAVHIRSMQGGLIKAYGPSLRSARTDADGRFAFQGVGEGIAVLHVPPFAGHAGLDDIKVKGGRTDVDLRLVPGGRIEVALQGPGGEPLAGMTVTAVPSPGGQPIPLTPTVAGGARYQTPLLAHGTYRVQVHEGAGYTKLNKSDVPVPGPLLRLRVGKALWIRGRVEHPRAADFWVTFDIMEHGAQTGDSAIDFCDANGAFELHLPAGSEGLLYAHLRELGLYVLLPDVRGPSRALTLVPKQGARLRGRVDHEDAAGRWVSIVHASGLEWFERLSPDGDFEIQAVPPGMCTVIYERGPLTLRATGRAGEGDIVLR